MRRSMFGLFAILGCAPTRGTETAPAPATRSPDPAPATRAAARAVPDHLRFVPPEPRPEAACRITTSGRFQLHGDDGVDLGSYAGPAEVYIAKGPYETLTVTVDTGPARIRGRVHRLDVWRSHGPVMAGIVGVVPWLRGGAEHIHTRGEAGHIVVEIDPIVTTADPLTVTVPCAELSASPDIQWLGNMVEPSNEASIRTTKPVKVHAVATGGAVVTVTGSQRRVWTMGREGGRIEVFWPMTPTVFVRGWVAARHVREGKPRHKPGHTHPVGPRIAHGRALGALRSLPGSVTRDSTLRDPFAAEQWVGSLIPQRCPRDVMVAQPVGDRLFQVGVIEAGRAFLAEPEGKQGLRVVDFTAPNGGAETRLVVRELDLADCRLGPRPRQ